MNKIFWGLLLLFIDIRIHGFNIPSSFIGYLLICLGLRETTEVPIFRRVLPWAAAGAVLCLPLGHSGGILLQLARVVATGIQLWVAFQIVLGVEELEYLHTADLGARRLHRAWDVMAVSGIAALVLRMLCEALNLLSISLAVRLLLIAWLACAIIYLVAFYRSKQAFAELKFER